MSGSVKDHNRCGHCGVDFGSVATFDQHREGWRIVRDHSLLECARLCQTNKHPRGECQKLVGHCTDPLELGLSEVLGVWHTPEGAEKALRMSEMGKRSRST